MQFEGIYGGSGGVLMSRSSNKRGGGGGVVEVRLNKCVCVIVRACVGGLLDTTNTLMVKCGG